MRIQTIVVNPGKKREVHTATGIIQVIGGLDKIAVRAKDAAAGTPDTIYSDPQVFQREKSVLKVIPFRPIRKIPNPTIDYAV